VGPLGRSSRHAAWLNIWLSFTESVCLTPSVMDPNSGTPEYKGFPVNLEKV